MRDRSALHRRAGVALAAMTVLVTASVGSCDLPQPRFPTLGTIDTRARGAVSSLISPAPGRLLRDVEHREAVGR